MFAEFQGLVLRLTKPVGNPRRIFHPEMPPHLQNIDRSTTLPTEAEIEY